MQSSTGMLTGACAAGGDLRECVALSLPESPQPEQVLSGLPLDLPGPTQPEKTLQRLGGAQTWRFTWAEEALVGDWNLRKFNFNIFCMVETIFIQIAISFYLLLN